MKLFGKRLREKRLEAGMTQQDLGDRLNKTKNNISQYELGKREPDLAVLAEMGRIFGCSLDELSGGEAPETVLREEAPTVQRLIQIHLSSPDGEPCGTHLPPPCCMAGRSYFYLYAPDDALREERIRAGDLLLICRDKRPEDGGVTLLRHGGKLTLRMLTRAPDGMLLFTRAGEAPLYVPEAAVEIIGYVVYVEFTPGLHRGT